jgi:hypothetical protein
MSRITKGLYYKKIIVNMNSKELAIHITKYNQNLNQNLTLLLSKVSEAILPNQNNNHIGEGSTMDEFIKHQQGVRFIINGGFSHYRKNFYEWSHQDYNVGDPVGVVKIREHIFEDFLETNNYGYLTQKEKGQFWTIESSKPIGDYKYILGCTPLLIMNKTKVELPKEKMIPVAVGSINPPSVLGHGLQDHPRTAVGIKNDSIYFVTVSTIDGTSGCNLIDLQEIGFSLKFDSFLNLDGGGSSQYQLKHDSKTIKNAVAKEDENRILGHVIVIFDETLKNKS